MGNAGSFSQFSAQVAKKKKAFGTKYAAMEGHYKTNFYSNTGLFPAKLGRTMTNTVDNWGLVNKPHFQDILKQYSQRFRALLGGSLLSNEQADDIHVLLQEGNRYAGSDRSEKDDIGAHAYGFTRGKKEGTI